LFVAKNGRDNERVTGGSVVDQDQGQEEKEEVTSIWIQSHSEVSNATEHRWHRNREGQLRGDLGPEVGSDLVHVVVDFSQENWAFVWENQDHILNGVHRDVHSHEEQTALDVLESLSVVVRDCLFPRGCCLCINIGVLICTGLPEEEGHERSSDASGCQLNVRGLGQTDHIQEVAGRKQLVLVTPWGHDLWR